MTTSILRGPWTATSSERLELGEGARWIDGDAVLVDLLRGRLLRLASAGSEPGLETLLELDVPLGAVCPRSDGGWIAAGGTGIVLLDPDGAATWVDRPAEQGATALRMNDGAADAQGRFWAGSMPYDGTPGAGALYRVDTDLTVTEVLSDLTIPNGPAFDADGTLMYLADSALGVVRLYAVDPDSGELSGGDVFARVEDASPDGMTVDAEGCLWVALWGGARLHRYAPDGSLLEAIPVPARQPTSIAISAGPSPEVVVTTAAHSLTPQGADGFVLRAPVGVTGLPVRPFIRR